MKSADFFCLNHVCDWQPVYGYTINKSNESKHKAAYKITTEFQKLIGDKCRVAHSQLQVCVSSCFIDSEMNCIVK